MTSQFVQVYDVAQNWRCTKHIASYKKFECHSKRSIGGAI
jgi:hypothetical protein